MSQPTPPPHPAPPLGAPPGAPGTPAPRREPTVEEVARSGRRAMQFGLGMAATMLLTFLSFPYATLAVPVGLFAVVLGVRATVGAVRVRAKGLLTPTLIVGTLLTTVFTLSMASTLLVWDIQSRHARCVGAALTVQAKVACQEQTEHDLQEWRDDMLTRAGVGPASSAA